MDGDEGRDDRWSGSGRILVIDDEETVRTVIARMVETFGFEALTVSSGREGVEELERQHGAVRCILLDLTMPGMGGEDAYDAIRDIDASVPVVLVTGFDDQDVAGRFGPRELAAIVQKPFDLETIRGTLREVLG